MMVNVMADTVLVQVRLPRALVNELDQLVAQGYHKSRTEAIEDAIRHFLMQWHTTSEAGKLTALYLSGRLPKRSEADPLSIVVHPDLARKRLLEEFGTDNVEEVVRAVRRKP